MEVPEFPNTTFKVEWHINLIYHHPTQLEDITLEKATPGHYMDYGEKVDNRCSKKAVLLPWRDTELVSYLFSSKTTFHAHILFTGINNL